MKNYHAFFTTVLVLVASSVAATPVQAAQDGGPKGLGFLIDNNFSTFIEVVGVDEFGDPVRETILDIFEAVTSSNPDLEDEFTQEELEGSDLLGPGVPNAVALNIFLNVLDAIDDLESVENGGDLRANTPRIAFNPDPFIAYSITFSNASDAPAEFNYNFLFPVLPVVGPTDVVSQLSLDLVDANGDGSASITLSSFSPFDDAIQLVGFMEGGIFGTFTDPDLGVGTEITTLGETLFAPAISAGPEADTAFDALTVFGQFTLSAGDSVTVTGLGGLVEAGGFLPTLSDFNFDNFPSTAIPEPSSALLLLLGLATGLGYSRNRHRA